MITSTHRLSALAVLVMAASLLPAGPAAAQRLTVTSTTPSSGAQGTSNLDVHIKGSSFEPGSAVYFFRSGTSDSAGITVKRTAFVSTAELIATIDIDPNAALSYYDVVVVAPNTRSGKGGDLFQVVASGARAGSGCTLEPLDSSRFVLETELNPAAAPLYGPSFGVSSMLGTAKLTDLPDGSTRTVLVAAVGGSFEYPYVEFFVLDRATGQVLDGTPLCDGCAAQIHQTIAVPRSVDGTVAGSGRAFAQGDVNGDGIADFVVGDTQASAAALFIGHHQNGRLTWEARPIPREARLASFGAAVALGDIDGDGHDEIVVGKPTSGSGKQMQGGRIYVFRYANDALNVIDTVPQSAVVPTLKNDDGFGSAVAIGDVTGDSHGDLIAGIPQREVNGITNAGAVLVLPGTDAGFGRGAVLLRAATVVRDNQFGYRVAAGDVTGDGRSDVVATTAWTSSSGGDVLSAPAGDQANGPAIVSTLHFAPRAGLEGGWATYPPVLGDVNGDMRADLLIGAPNAGNTGSCSSPGMAYLFLGTGAAGEQTTGWTRTTLQAPAPDVDFAGFGWAVALSDAQPIIVISENGRDLAGSPRGQAYVYRVVQTP